MPQDNSTPATFREQWPKSRLLTLVAFLTAVTWALAVHHPTGWFALPAALLLLKLLHDARRANRPPHQSA